MKRHTFATIEQIKTAYVEELKTYQKLPIRSHKGIGKSSEYDNCFYVFST